MNLLLLLACTDPGTLREAGTNKPRDTAEADADTDADSDADADTDIETVPVSHTREMRGLYVATVYDIDWPDSYDDSASTQQADILTLLDVAEASGMNAIFIQVRPEGDALYASNIEPWSRWLTGTQGVDPGYDPLAVWVSEAHARNIEVHAWLNPYRAKAGGESTSGLVSGHMALDFPQYAYPYGGDLWMDPAAEVVRERVVAVVADLLASYDLDGINFDDYFYPYPDDGDFPDDSTWAAYQASGGGLSRDDWRRSNTAALVRDVAAEIAKDPTVRFGIAPFGIWKSGTPSGIVGLDAYEELYADPLDWVDSGYLDYLAPQLYWETGNEGQEYEPLAEWWSSEMPSNVWMMPANALYQVGTSSTWTLDEFADQIEISRSLGRGGGNLWYGASALLADTSGIQDAFATRYYPTPALPPVVNALSANAEPPPELTLDGSTVRWAATSRRAITVYAAAGDGWALSRIVPAAEGAVTLSSGSWALASVGRGDVESEGVVVEIP